MTGPLTGRAVLLPRSPQRGAGLAALLRAQGADVTVAPVIERAPALDGDALAAAVRDVLAGRYAWTVITSVNAVDALAAAARDVGVTSPPGAPSTEPPSPDVLDAPAAADIPVTDTARSPLTDAPTRWAAVGPATRRALAAIGVDAELVPDDASAAGMVAVFPAPTSETVTDTDPTADDATLLRAPATAPSPAVTDATTEVGGGVSRTSSSDPEWRSRSDRERDVARDTPPSTAPKTAVLLPLGDLATPVLRDGLVALGWTPHVVTAYRTVRSDLPADVVARRFDVVVVTSGSVAREVAAQLGTSTPVVAIGRPSADVAREVGLTVAVVADRPTDAALAAAVTTVLERNP